MGLFAISIKVKAQEQIKGQEWKSIVTLRTTRDEVEKRFGKPDESDDSGPVKLYKLENYNLLVNYAHGCNNTEKSDYNVPQNTVTHFTVYLKFGKKIPLTALNIDKTKFEKTVLPSETYLSNNDEGVSYRISEDEVWVISIDFYPKKEDYKLNCSKLSKK
jgi:hypothetical protein